MRSLLPYLLLSASALAAQAPRQFTDADYARAEKFLAAGTASLVSGVAGRATWLADGRFYYRVSTPQGNAFQLVDAARKTKALAFDHARLGAALAAASGSPVDGNRLPFATFDLSADSKVLT
ncbi:MAG: S9 family peptidase, partial [Gemmatimonadetes bacterium]|nr:S9 family peptidase [Gemmatimonadota bacterium]